jgi:hypothetical protein
MLEGIKEMEKAKELEPTPHLKGQLASLYARANRKDGSAKSAPGSAGGSKGPLRHALLDRHDLRGPG